MVTDTATLEAALDLYDRRLAASRQLPAVSALAGWLVPVLVPYVRHDGTSRGRSRTAGWMLRATPEDPFARTDHEELLDFIGDTLDDTGERLERYLRLGPLIREWDRRRRYAVEGYRPDDERGLRFSPKALLDEIDREMDADHNYRAYQAVTNAARKFAWAAPYAHSVTTRLRSAPELRLRPDDPTDGRDASREWLRSTRLPSFIPKRQLWETYVAAGSPGALPLQRFYAVATEVFGPPSRPRRGDGARARGYLTT